MGKRKIELVDCSPKETPESTEATKAKKLGRPSKYSEELALTICERLAMGESLKAICTDKAMPTRSMVYRWKEANQPFRDMYARAREAP